MLTYLEDKHLSSYFSWKILSLLDGLNFNETDRFDIYQVLTHEYLKVYFSKYKSKIEAKSEKQKSINKTQHKIKIIAIL